MKFKSKLCLNCNQSFIPTSSQDIWCNSCKTITCIVCSQTKIIAPSRILRGEQYCSNKCWYTTHTKEKHPSFKNYISYQKAQGYLCYTDRHPLYPKQAIHRVLWMQANPNGLCQDCGSKFEIVHHIDENKLNNELDNLVGLCRKCHNIRHWQPDTTRICKFCNKTYYAPNKPGRIFLFCSTNCRRSFYKI